MNRARHLLQSSVIVIFFLAIDKVFGLVRTQLMAAFFGTGGAADAFTAANQLPELFVTLISGGALAAAFIPVYSSYLNTKSAKETAQLANTTLTLVIVILGSISLIGAIFSPWLTQTFLNFPPGEQALTAELMRIILIQTTIFGVSGLISSILNSHQHFILPAMAPIALNIGYLFGFFILVPSMGIHGLAWGTVIGAVLHVLIQVPGLIKYGVHLFPQLVLGLAGVTEIIRLMVPRIVTLGTVQAADLFIISITSGLGTGATSGYFFGYYLQQLPETLFGTAIALVLFPTMAERFNEGDIEGLKRIASNGLRIIWLLTVPSAAALILLGRPLISLLLERGEFTSDSTNLVYSIIVFFSLRVVSEATLEIAARLFFAQHDTRTPMFVAIGWLVANVALAYLLVEPLGIGGLALATSIAFTLQTAVLLYLNHRKLNGLDWKGLGISFGRTAVATSGMSAVIIGISQIVENTLIFLATAIVLGFLVYIVLQILLGGREIPALISLVRGRSSQQEDQ